MLSLAAALLAAVLAVGFARAQDPAVPATPNTEVTPQPVDVKNNGQWTVLGGAQFGKDGELTGASATEANVDFYATSFSPDAKTGLFGGAACDEGTPFADLDKCERHPALYSVTADAVGDTQIAAVADLPHSGRGFIAAISWLSDDRALLVGGSGAYPERERRVSGDLAARQADDATNGAGRPRVWLYDEGVVTEIGDELPSGMTALTAIVCGETKLKGTCMAGGLGQVWAWLPDSETRSEGFSGAPEPVPDLTYRVRDLRSLANESSEAFFGVTSGCCSELADGRDPAQGPAGPRFLTLSFDNSNGTLSWTSDRVPGATEAGAAGDQLTDSFSSLVVSSSAKFSALAVSGGPSSAGTSDPGTRILYPQTATLPPARTEITGLALKQVRLTGADGDVGVTGDATSSVISTGTPHPGDGTLDWAVGSLTADGRGVAYTTVPPPTPRLPPVLFCDANRTLVDLEGSSAPTNCGLTTAKLAEYSTDAKRMVAFPTYALTSIQFVPGTDGGIAWAAGKRGALARLGGGGAIGAEGEPEATIVGASSPTAAGEAGPLEQFQPTLGGAKPGIVPALVQQPEETSAEPEMVPAGTSDPTRPSQLRREAVADMALSRDGSEGWAVGTGTPQHGASPGVSGDRFTVDHYDGERWTRCDSDGMGGAYAPDPECASLDALLHRTGSDGKAIEPPVLSAIARIPFERDDDPSNDDEFGAVAIGSPVTGSRGTVADLVGGRWRLDDDADIPVAGNGYPAVSVAFRTPGDGWAVTVDTSGHHIYHYTDGDWPNGKWVDCSDSGDPCKIAALPLSTSGTQARVAVAGDTLFMAGIGFTQGAAGVNNVGAQGIWVASKKPGEPWTVEFDPLCLKGEADCTPDNTGQGDFSGLSVADLGDGHIAGWISGRFATTALEGSFSSSDSDQAAGTLRTLVRRDPKTGKWAFRNVNDAASQYMLEHEQQDGGIGQPWNWRVVSYRGDVGQERSFLVPAHNGLPGPSYGPVLAYDPAADRWQAVSGPFIGGLHSKAGPTIRAARGYVTATSPDADGGLWLATEQAVDAGPKQNPQRGAFYYHYTDRAHRPVFTDVGNPIRFPISGVSGLPDGGMWIATESDRLYRYNRILGWDEIPIKGWDAGRLVTRPSHALAIDVNDAETGVVVGERGRVADVSGDGVQLDEASGHRCSDGPPPCGTPRDLRSVSVAPDGSAMIGGDNLTLMWRPAGGDFRTVSRPAASAHTSVTGVALPDADHAWITTASGEIWAGQRRDSDWVWVLDVSARQSSDDSGHSQLNAIAVDSHGRGLSVGDRGSVFERSVDGTWTRIKTGYLDDLLSIALPAEGFVDGTLVGGREGLILTRIDGHFHTARPADIFDPLITGDGQRWTSRTVGLAVAGGSADGEVEAWAAVQGVTGYSPAELRTPAPMALLHYASSDDALLNPDRRVAPLPDVEPPSAHELTLAAFGRSDCQAGAFCTEMQGDNLFSDVISMRIRRALLDRRRESTGPMAAVFTGDISSQPGRNRFTTDTPVVAMATNTPTDPNIAHERWRDRIAKPLTAAGVPLFAALGKLDLSRASECYGTVVCADTQTAADAGVSLQWRQTFADMSAPWGSGPEASSADAKFVPVDDPGTKQEAPGGGAHTHYAIDVVRDGKTMARLIFLDNSFSRSLTLSEGDQNPVDGNGGQTAWLEQVLCIKGETCSSGGTRDAKTPAIVITNAPTYSYGPGGLDSVEADGTVLETLLIRHHATATISGRLGWNALYYTIASGVHAPCAGEAYPAKAPDAADRPCGTTTAAAADTPNTPSAGKVSDALRGTEPALPPAAQGPAGTVSGTTATAQGLVTTMPNLIAASAGSRFGPAGADDGTAAAGYWHGYSLMRLREDGSIIVEQRPILDWIGIDATTHVLRPGQKMTLRGYGREPVGYDNATRFVNIDSPSITHRYDLLEADPEHPWQPKRDAQGQYLPLDPSVATVDQFSGKIVTGKGSHERAYVLGLLSVGKRSASWPIVFEPRKSFVTRRLQVITPPVVPRIQVASFTPQTLQTPTSAPPTTAPPPVSINVNVPAPPPLPPLPNPTTPVATPPVPPVPPAPPASHHAQPLDLTVTPVGVAVPPTTGVTAQPTPPVNPSPPSGARREAKQRQAATAKSEEGGAGGEGVDPSDAQSRVNSVDSPNAYTRRSEHPLDGRHAFTALTPARHASAGPNTALLYGGGITLMALIMSLGWTIGRPRSRRKPSTVAVPAWNRTWNGRNGR